MDGPHMRQGKQLRHKTLAAYVAWLVTALTVALIAAGCGTGSSIEVNGVAIPSSVVNLEVNRRLEVARRKNPSELKGSRGARLEAETRKQVATDFIKAELTRQQAKKMGVKLASDEVNRRIEEESKTLGSVQFNKNLASQGLTLDRYKTQVENQALVEALGNKVSENVTVTVDQAESFYLTHKNLFSQALMVHAAQVLLDTQGQADMVATEAKGGADFGTLAKTFSTDAATRPNGGDLGWIQQGTGEPALDQVMFTMQPGQVSGVVQASDGFHIVKVLERREASTPPFSEVAGKAVTTLTNRKKEEVFSDWLRTVYANAVVNAGSAGRWDPRLGAIVSP